MLLLEINDIVHAFVVKLIELIVLIAFNSLLGCMSEKLRRYSVLRQLLQLSLQVVQDVAAALLNRGVDQVPLLLEFSSAVIASSIILKLQFINLFETAFGSWAIVKVAHALTVGELILQLLLEDEQACLEDIHQVDVEEVDKDLCSCASARLVAWILSWHLLLWCFCKAQLLCV